MGDFDHQNVLIQNLGFGQLIYDFEEIPIDLQRAAMVSPIIRRNLSQSIKDEVEFEFELDVDCWELNDVQEAIEIINGNRNVISSEKIGIYREIFKALEIDPDAIFPLSQKIDELKNGEIIRAYQKAYECGKEDHSIEDILDSYLDEITGDEFIAQDFDKVWPVLKSAYKNGLITGSKRVSLLHSIIDIRRWGARAIVEVLTNDNFTNEEIAQIIIHLLDDYASFIFLDVKVLYEKIAQLEREISRINSEKEFLQNKISELNNIIKKLRNEKDDESNSKRIRELLIEIEGLKEKLKNADILQKKIDELEKEIAKLKSQISSDEDLRRQILELQAKLRQKESEISDLNKRLARLEEENRELKSKGQTQQTVTNAGLEEANKLIAELRQLLKKEKSKSAALASELELNKNLYEKSRNEKEELRREILEFTKKLQEANRRAEAAEKKANGKSGPVDPNTLQRIKELEIENAILRGGFEGKHDSIKEAIDEENMNLLLALVTIAKTDPKKQKEPIDDLPPLLYALINNHQKCVRMMLENGFNPNVKDNEGMTALFHVLTDKETTVFEDLLKFGADPKIVNKNKDSLLHLACSDVRLDFVKILLENGVNIEAKNANGETPLIVALHQNYCDDVATYLVEKGADITVKASKKETVIHLAIMKYAINFLESIKDRIAPFIDNIASYRETALIIACRWGYKNGSNFLLDHGADINIPSGNKTTALMYALKTRMLKVALRILEMTPDVTYKNNDGNSPLSITIDNKDEEIALQVIEKDKSTNFKIDGVSLLAKAIENDMWKLVDKMLERGWVVKKLNQDNDNMIHYLIKHGTFERVEKAVELGLDINTKNALGLSPLCIAMENGNEELAKRVLDFMYVIEDKEKGTSKTMVCDVDQLGSDGSSLLAVALRNNMMGIAHDMIGKKWKVIDLDSKKNNIYHLMIECECFDDFYDEAKARKADINYRNEDGDTPIILCIRGNNSNAGLKVLQTERFSGSSLQMDEGNPIIIAIEKKMSDEFIIMLMDKAPTSIFKLNPPEFLSIAMKCGNESIIGALLRQGINLSDLDLINTAIDLGLRDTPKNLVEKGAPVTCKDADGRTSLFKAIVNGRTDLTKLLYEKAPEAADEKDNNGDTIISWCIKNKKFDLLRSILELKNINVNMCDGVKDTGLLKSIKMQFEDAAKLFIQKHADVTIPDKEERSPLHLAVMSKLGSIVKDILKEVKEKNSGNLKSFVNAKMKDGRTPLELSLMEFPEVAISLINSGAESTDDSLTIEDSLLHRAARKKDLDPNILSRMITSGADVNKQNKEGNTPVMESLDAENYKGYITFVDKCETLDDLGSKIDFELRNKNFQLVTHILASHNPTIESIRKTSASWTDPDYDDNIPIVMLMGQEKEIFAEALFKIHNYDKVRIGPEGNCITHELIRTENERHLSLISKYIDLENSDGYPAMHYAAKLNNANAIRIMVKECEASLTLGMTVKIDPQHTRSITPLHVAALNGSTDALVALIELGANINEVTSDGMTAIVLAIENRPNLHNRRRDTQCIEKMLELGACAASIKKAREALMKKVSPPPSPPSDDQSPRIAISGSRRLNVCHSCPSPRMIAKPVLSSRMLPPNTSSKFSLRSKVDASNEFMMCIDTAVQNKDVDVVTLLMAAFDKSPLIYHTAVRLGNEKLVQLLLVTSLTNCNECDALGMTPLMIAVSMNRNDIVNVLLGRARYININTHNRLNGMTALFYAVSQQMVYLLLERGADPGEVDVNNTTAADYLRSRGDPNINTALDSKL